MCLLWMWKYIWAGCLYGQLRLSNGSEPNVGRLEICINNKWGTICDDKWTHTNAQVACRQLGYSTDGKIVPAQNWKAFALTVWQCM